MQTRILPREEWHRLAGTELETVIPYLPASASVIVVEDGDQIVGCWSVFEQTHVEGVWIAPEYRGRGSVARRLIATMVETARARGAQTVWTAAVTPDVADLALRLGAVELHARHFSLKIGE